MARITVSQRIPVPPERVWPHLADLGSHATWMKEAQSIVFTTEQTRGVGTVMEVETRVGPFRTLDVTEVTGWVEGSAITVRHVGLVTGEGTLSIRADGEDTVVNWTEELTFPWYLGGPVTAWIAKPVLAAIWKANLRRFAGIVAS